MFDGIDAVILPAHDITALRTLYVELFGFTEIAETDVSDPAWQRLWHLPAAATRSVLLGKPASDGGWIRLVEAPGLPAPAPAGRPDRVGAYALDFYLRDPAGVEARIEAGGWTFRSPAVHYALPGTDIPVRERMLDQPVSGLLHAMVQYRGRGTRCVIDQDPGVDASEVVAAMFVTDRFEEAVTFATDVLGGHLYFRGRFDGPAVERMLHLSPGEGLAAALFRGPASRNARLEFAKAIGSGAATAPPDPVPRVIASCAVDDLAAIAGRLAGGRHGPTTGIVTIEGVRRLGLASMYGATFEFHERAGT
ncbi:hypothetical protein [Saccharopolyspora pogona]|uniref:hypothetical protein n=1 Tax=Saccharopolyspora pogona TaxID=333966 RepID=UPI001681D7EE|nr:hypothetical protein [Saccharopolyspora pogona]